MPIFPHKPVNISRTDDGFSLLEMLVVLAIMGLMLSLVGARLSQTLDSARFARTSQANLAKITDFRAEALLKRKALFVISPTTTKLEVRNIPRDSLRLFPFDDSFDVKGDIIKISPSGLCSGGRITVKNKTGRKAVYDLEPPNCTPKRVATP